MDSFLVSDDSVEVTAQNGNSNPTVDDFVVTYGTDAGSFLIVKVYMPIDGDLQAVKLTGDFLDAKIEVQQEGAAIPQLAIPKTGVRISHYTIIFSSVKYRGKNSTLHYHLLISKVQREGFHITLSSSHQ